MKRRIRTAAAIGVAAIISLLLWRYLLAPRLYERAVQQAGTPGVETQVTETSTVHDVQVTADPREIQKLKEQKGAVAAPKK